MATMVVVFIGILLLCFISVQSHPNSEAISGYNAALEFHRINDNLNAIFHYQQAIDAYFEFPEAHQNIGLLYESIGDLDKAAFHHQQSVLLAETPEFKAGSLVNLVLISMKSQTILSNAEFDRLLLLLNEANDLNPGDPNIEFTIGLIRDQMGHFESALASFNRILATHPNHSLALMNVGNYYFRKNHHVEAAFFFERCIGSLPDWDTTHLIYALNNLGQSYREQGTLNRALQAFLRAASLSIPSLTSSEVALRSTLDFYSLNNVFTVQGLLSQWRNLELWEHLLERFVLAYHEGDPSVSGAGHLRYDKLLDPYTMSLVRHGSLRFDRAVSLSACGVAPVYTHPSSSPSSAVLRVGYLSFDWRDHPMGRLTSHLVTAHNRSRVESVSFSYGPDDGSTIRRQVERDSPTFVDIHRLRNDADAAALVHSHQLDILVDLTAFTYNGRFEIAALKPAPVVINYLGFPGTTGCSGFDFSLVDRVVVPPEIAGQHFTERLIYLPHTYQANSMPAEVLRCSDRRSCRAESGLLSADAYRSRFGEVLGQELLARHVREGTRWLCSFNANKKMEPLSFAVWMNILSRASSAVLVLLDMPSDARVEVLRSAAAHGVDGSRLVFVGRESWEKHLNRSAACDLMLDTFVYGAHTTSSDLLWAGVPVLTLAGFGSDRMPSRVAASIVGSLIGQRDSLSPLNLIIADSLREYEDVAVRLVTDLSTLAAVKGALLKRVAAAPTFDRQLMQRHIELSYQLVSEARAVRGEGRLPHLVTSSLVDPSPPALTIAEVLTVEGLLSDVRSLTLMTDRQREKAMLGISAHLTRHVTASGQDSMLKVLDTQYALSGEHSLDARLFDLVRELLFRRCGVPSGSPESAAVHSALTTMTQWGPEFSVEESRLYCPAEDSSPLERVILSRILKNRAVSINALLTSGDHPALAHFLLLSLSSYLLDPSPDALRSLGLVVMDKAGGPLGGRVLSLGYQLASEGVRDSHLASFIAHPLSAFPSEEEEEDGRGRSVVFYCHEYGQSWWPGWGPSSIAAGRGLGGSEEAVYQTAIELAARGYAVRIYSELPPQDVGVVTHRSSEGPGHILWLHHSNLDLTQRCDVFVAWRYSISLALGRQMASRTYLWLHDLVPGTVLPEGVFSDHDGVFVQSSFHRDHVMQEAARFLDEWGGVSVEEKIRRVREKVFIIPNGISVTAEDLSFPPLRNDNDLFVYGSAPNRGLAFVLRAWSSIRAQIPSARLEVYYGFTDSVVKHLKEAMGEGHFGEWMRQMQVLLQQEGVTYVGAVDAATLKDAYSRAGFWLYPTTFQETGCITGIKAMAGGAIPITSRLQESVLMELTDKYDLGPFAPLTLSTAVDGQKLAKWVVDEWIPAVVRAHGTAASLLHDHRAIMRYEVTHEYSWRSTASKLSALFKRDLGDRQK